MTEAVPERVHAEIERLLADRLGRFGFYHADVHSEVGYDGDPVLVIDASYHHSDEPVDPVVTLQTLVDLQRLLMAHGDERFPNLNHRFAPGQVIARVDRDRLAASLGCPEA